MTSEQRQPLSILLKPQSLSEVVGHTSHVQFFQGCMKQKIFPHVFIHGSPGTGKSTIVNAYLKDLQKIMDVCVESPINASDKRNTQELVYDTLLLFCRRNCGFRIAILEEADNISKDAQEQLCGVLDECSEKKRDVQLIMVANDPSCVIDELKLSRGVNLEFKALPTSILVSHLSAKLLQFPSFPQWSSQALTMLVQSCAGDMRQTLNTIQQLNDASIIVSKTVEVEHIQRFLPPSPSVQVLHFLLHLQKCCFDNQSGGSDRTLSKKSILVSLKTQLKDVLSTVKDVYKWIKFWLFEYFYENSETDQHGISLKFRSVFIQHLKHQLGATPDALNFCISSNHNWIGFTHLILSFYDSVS